MSRARRDFRGLPDPRVLWAQSVLLVRTGGLVPQVHPAHRVRRGSQVRPVSRACLARQARRARWVLTEPTACLVLRALWDRTACPVSRDRRVSTERQVFLVSLDRLVSTDFQAPRALREWAVRRAPTVQAEFLARMGHRGRRGRRVRLALKDLLDRSVLPSAFVFGTHRPCSLALGPLALRTRDRVD